MDKFSCKKKIQHKILQFEILMPIQTPKKAHLHEAKANPKKDIFLWSLPLFNVNNKLDFLRTRLEAASISRSLSLNVNGPDTIFFIFDATQCE